MALGVQCRNSIHLPKNASLNGQCVTKSTALLLGEVMLL